MGGIRIIFTQLFRNDIFEKDEQGRIVSKRLNLKWVVNLKKTGKERYTDLETEKQTKIQKETSDKAVNKAVDATEKEHFSRNRILIILSIVLLLVGAVTIVWLGRTLGNRKQYEGELWYGNVKEADTAADTLSGMEAFALQNSAGDSSLADSWEYGNDMQIYRSGALLAMDEKYYYVANTTDGGKLYRITRDGSAQREKITEIPASMISLKEDRLYFVSSYDNASNARGIYGVNTDGTQLEYLSDAVPEYMMLVNDWLYYLSANDSHIYKLNVRERREILLTDKTCVSMTIQENVLYFSYQEELEEEDTVHILASMDLDGNSYRELARGEEYHYLTYAEGRIYYIPEDWSSLCSVNPDGSDVNTVLTSANQISRVRICGDKLYYLEYGDDGKSLIAEYNSETGVMGHYNLEYVKNFFLFDGKIYVNYLDGTEEKVSVYNLEDGSLIPFFE